MTRGFTCIIGLTCGLLGGLFGGLLGLGGGVIMIPLMTWLAKVSQHQAHGTSLVAIVFTAVVGSVAYYAHGGVDWRAALILAVSATITARFGARYAHSLPEKKLKRAFGIFLIFASAMLVVKGYLPRIGLVSGFWSHLAVFFLIGLITGFVSGMMGVGGGGVMVPLMVVLANMGQHMAQGTSLLAMVPASITGASIHYRLGNVRMDIALGLAAGSFIGGAFGAVAANGLPELYLKIVFAAVGTWMGARYIRTAARKGDR